MEWVAENWLILLLLGGCLGMHIFMPGHMHGNHGRRHSHDFRSNGQNTAADPAPEPVPVRDDPEIPLE